MSRRIAFLVIALIGFSIGVILYVIGVFLVPMLIKALPQFAYTFNKYKYVFGAIASGLVGSIIAVVIAYIWATRSEF